MTHAHDTHGHGSTTVVERDTEGPAMLLIVIVVLAALALLIWFFAFSGVVFDRGGDSGPNTNIEQQIDQNQPQDTTVPGGGVPEPTGT